MTTQPVPTAPPAGSPAPVGSGGGRGMRARLARIGTSKQGVNPELEPLFRAVRANHPKADLALLERANKLLQDEARQPTRDPAPASEIGALLLQIHQERQGLYWMDQALVRDPDHQPTHKALAEYFEKKGDAERAALHRRRLK